MGMYTFRLNNMVAHEIRSAFNDTVIASISLKLGNQESMSASWALGEVKAGETPNTLSLELGPVNLDASAALFTNEG